MFLQARSRDFVQDDRIFGFHVAPGSGEFSFHHEGLNLADLAETLDLSLFGNGFYLTDVTCPVTLAEVLADTDVFRSLYGIDPMTAHGGGRLRWPAAHDAG